MHSFPRQIVLLIMQTWNEYLLIFDCVSVSKRSVTWKEYASVAGRLVMNGFYNGLLEGIVDCLKMDNNVFIVIDAPSGSGKTLFGIALLLIDKDFTDPECDVSSKRSELELQGLDLKVIHCIWPGSLVQNIYKEIIKEQPFVRPNIIFERAKFLDMARVLQLEADEEWIENHVWFTVLQYVFEIDKKKIVNSEAQFSVSEFRAAKNLADRYILIYADEVPVKPSELYVIFNLREAIKRVHSVGIALAGTNSKAANMIGLSEASSVDTDAAPWALFVTRLPRFQMELSNLKDIWENVKVQTARSSSDLAFAVNAIASSIHNGGNPRLICQAISSLQAVLNPWMRKDLSETFSGWQECFVRLVNLSKFQFKTHSGKYAEMNGQLNLLLEASQDAELSDTMLANRFAYRAVPDASESGSTAFPKLQNCAGWLYFSQPEDRCLGRSLVYVSGCLQRTAYLPSVKHQWQTTLFAPVRQDILLYLGTCRVGGFFDSGAPSVSPFLTCKVVSACWKSNAAGSVNFQNPDAENNPGTKLEVTVTAAVCNAAASRGKGRDFAGFLFQFAKELGVNFSSESETEIPIQLQQDKAFDFCVPRYLFPGEGGFCQTGSLIGFVRRMRNGDQFDVQMTLPDQADFVSMEVNVRHSFSNKDLWIVCSKLFSSRNQKIGIVIVRNSCDYWGLDVASVRPTTNKTRLYNFLKHIQGEKVGQIYFIRSDGALETKALGDGARRLILIQVACSDPQY